MINLYYETAREIGFYNPPKPILTTLPAGELARAVKEYEGRGFSEKTLGYQILLDEDQLNNYHVHPKFIIAHELMHVECRHIIDGGGATADGQKHGASFLAGWLQMLRRLQLTDSDVAELARFHARHYELSKNQLTLAVKAAYTHDTPNAAANEAVIFTPTPPWQNMILVGIVLVFATYFLIMFN
jgi:hypothetical protein